MRIRRIEARIIRVPLAISFSHARAKRTESENVLVIVEDSSGRRGYGESVPRPYVTGETTETVLHALRQAKWNVLEDAIECVEEIAVCLDALDLPLLPGDDRKITANCARCAVDLALLDLLGKNVQKPVSALLSSKLLPSDACAWYSGVVSSGSKKKIFSSLIKMRLFGFRDVKLKVGEDDELDAWTVRVARKFFKRGRKTIRIDANGAWTLDRAKRMLARLEAFGIASCEQPLPHERSRDLPALREASPIPLMLDESLCSMRDAERAVDRRACDLFNLRISKCGGLLGTMAIAEFARDRGIKFQIGCQVGETALLSAAGRHLAFVLDDALFLEGSYDRFLLADNVSDRPVSFRYGGRAYPLRGPGLGVNVSDEHIEKLTISKPILLFSA